MNLHVFSATPTTRGRTSMFVSIVIATNVNKARKQALDAQGGRLRRHLREQMGKGGGYEGIRSIKAAFEKYYPFHRERALRPGSILLSANGESTVFR
jgi:hypothetical protein